MLIEIVSHCYASVHKHYAAALCYQLSSLVLYPPKKCEVMVTVCYSSKDEHTTTVLKTFQNKPIDVSTVCLSPSKLGRRAIGRNAVALSSWSDIIWFADVDQAFQEGCLDRLAEMEWPEDCPMIYPRDIMIHKDHETGDTVLEKAAIFPRLLDVDEKDFVHKRYHKAIGGVQIVKGEFARQHGYLSGDKKWQKPTNGEFQACRCDVAYRRFCSQFGKIKGVDLPGLYRLRHSVAAHGRKPKSRSC